MRSYFSGLRFINIKYKDSLHFGNYLRIHVTPDVTITGGIRGRRAEAQESQLGPTERPWRIQAAWLAGWTQSVERRGGLRAGLVSECLHTREIPPHQLLTPDHHEGRVDSGAPLGWLCSCLLRLPQLQVTETVLVSRLRDRDRTGTSLCCLLAPYLSLFFLLCSIPVI